MILAALAGLAASVCTLPSGWSEAVASRPRFVVFGETHGTDQSPALVGRAACALAQRGERLLVAVEFSSIQNHGLQAAWRLPHRRFAERLVAAMPEWRGREDGVASRAMLAMLVNLHALKARGARIDVVAFSGANGPEQEARFRNLPGQGPHEAAQAENIRNAADAAPHDRVLVLVGSVHAHKQPVTFRGTSFEPMAMRLAPASQIVSLVMVDGGGTMWNCLAKPGLTLRPGVPIGPEDMDCGIHSAQADAVVDSPAAVALGTPPQGRADPAFDGYYWVGAISGSPPAVPEP